jgi:hypothetical protein
MSHANAALTPRQRLRVAQLVVVAVTGLDGPAGRIFLAPLRDSPGTCDGYSWPHLQRWIHQWMDAAEGGPGWSREWICSRGSDGTPGSRACPFVRWRPGTASIEGRSGRLLNRLPLQNANGGKGCHGGWNRSRLRSMPC